MFRKFSCRRCLGACCFGKPAAKVFKRPGNKATRRERFLWVWFFTQFVILSASAFKHHHYLMAAMPALSVDPGPILGRPLGGFAKWPRGNHPPACFHAGCDCLDDRHRSGGGDFAQVAASDDRRDRVGRERTLRRRRLQLLVGEAKLDRRRGHRGLGFCGVLRADDSRPSSPTATADCPRSSSPGAFARSFPKNSRCAFMD